MTKQIPLSKGAVARVDDDLYPELMAVSWCLNSSGYAIHWYTDAVSGKRRGLLMHRYIMNAPAHLQVDHIDRDRLHNTRANLRFATCSQNQANKDVPSNNTSQYKGVVRNRGKWEARIGYHGQRVHLGRFVDAEQAALHYDAASRLLYGAFAGLNFPDRVTPPHVAEAVEAHITQNVLQRGGKE